MELCRTFSGDATSGTEMLGHCRDEKSMGWITGYCTGVIVGLLTAAPHMEAEVRFCPPNGITPTQARRVVVRYLEQNPQITHRELRYLGDRGAAKSMGRLRPDVYSLRPAGRRTPAACTLRDRQTARGGGSWQVHDYLQEPGGHLNAAGGRPQMNTIPSSSLIP